MKPLIGPRLQARAVMTLVASLSIAGCFDGLPGEGQSVPLKANAVAASPIPFESLAQRAPEGMLPRAASVFLAVTPAAAAPFLEYLAETDRQAVRRVEFSSRAVVAVFSGAVASSGHAIRVEQLTRDGSSLRIAVRILTPDPSGYALTVFTSPYHILTVPRAALGEPPPTSWILIDTAHQKTVGGGL
jgi:hypothetical protein